MSQIKKDLRRFSVSCCVVKPPFCILSVHQIDSFSHNPFLLRCVISQKFALLLFGQKE